MNRIPPDVYKACIGEYKKAGEPYGQTSVGLEIWISEQDVIPGSMLWRFRQLNEAFGELGHTLKLCFLADLERIRNFIFR